MKSLGLGFPGTQIWMVGLDVAGEGQVLKGIFVGAIDLGGIRQVAQARQALLHLRWRALENPAATAGKQGISAKQVAGQGIGQVVEGMPGYGEYRELRRRGIEMHSIAFTHGIQYGEDYYSFVNGQNTTQGGTHLAAFKEGLVRTIKDFYKKDYDSADIKTSIIAAVSIKVEEPIFESQTKTKLGSKDMGPGTGPGIIFAVFDNPRPDRIPFRIPHGAIKMKYVHWARDEPSLPEIPLPILAYVDDRCVFSVSFADRPDERGFRGGKSDEVNMVVHQTVSQDR